jgi:hypothetical protein
VPEKRKKEGTAQGTLLKKESNKPPPRNVLPEFFSLTAGHVALLVKSASPKMHTNITICQNADRHKLTKSTRPRSRSREPEVSLS